MENLQLTHPTGQLDLQVPLASSKSESNRALILQALSGGKIALENLSSARDTRTMLRLLTSNDQKLDVLDAGTTMRFLTAYLSVTNRKAMLTGTPRMCQRPIKILVDALRQVGASIDYLNEDGYPPLQIGGLNQTGNEVSIRGDVSSQYISALLMVAPVLPMGLSLRLQGHIGSRPYIQMTLEMMAHFGLTYRWEGDTIAVPAQHFVQGKYTIESDWSGASYWYSMAALAYDSHIFLKGLRQSSWQGDSAIVAIMEQLGVKSTFEEDGVRLEKSPHAASFTWDFTHCPDLAQTIAVVCAAKKIPARLTGLQSLRIKETDRIEAIRAELEKFGVSIKVEGDEAIELTAQTMEVAGQQVNTYDDHRMAMAFAPLALLGKINILEPGVVAKSYPEFWEHLTLAGFRTL